MKVLIAVEDSKYGAELVDFCKHHQWPAGSQFKLLHIVEATILDNPADVSYAPFLESYAQECTKQGKEMIEELAGELSAALPDMKIMTEVLQGYAKDKILDTARDWQSELIVMGSHGRRGLSRFLLGSVSSAVVSHAPCSVMVVRAGGGAGVSATDSQTTGARAETVRS